MAGLKFYDEKEGWPPEQRQRYFDEKVREIISFAYEHAPAIKERLDRAGVSPEQIRSTRDLEKVPITLKDEMVELQRRNPPFGGFFTGYNKRIRHICVSPGPLFEPETDPPERIGGMVKALTAAGFSSEDIVLNSFAYHLVPAGLGVDEAVSRVGAAVIPAGTGNTDLQVEIMREVGVTAFIGTPSFLYTIIQRAEQRGYNFRRDFKLRKAFLGAEMYPPSLRKILEQDYGIDTYEFYGTAELGTIGYQCPQKQGLHLAEDNFVEIVDSQGKQLGPGEVGQVVVTSFAPSYCLIRFGTGDLSLYTDEPCPCGRTSFRLVRIAGRVGDAVQVRGMFLHPREVEEALAPFSEVSNYQALVGREQQRDTLTIRVELREAVDREEFSRRLQQSLQSRCRLRADRIEFVEPGTIPEGRKTVEDIRVWE